MEVVHELRSHVLDRVKGDLSGANVAAALFLARNHNPSGRSLP